MSPPIERRAPHDRWVALPSPRQPRFVLPVSSRALATAGLLVYQPVTWRGLIGWLGARLVARLGGFRLLPAVDVPSELALASDGDPDVLVAVARSHRPNRSVVLLLDRAGRPVGVAKLARDEAGIRRLEVEADWVARVGPLLPPPLRAPGIVDHRPGMVRFDAPRWRARLRSWDLDPAVAAAIGTFYRQGGGDHRRGPAHGDFAPWNLLRIHDGWLLVDWEEATLDGMPFQDPFHWLVQSHALLRRPTARSLLAGVHGRGRIAVALDAYAMAAGLVGIDRPTAFREHLEVTLGAIDSGGPDHRRERDAREALLGRLDGLAGRRRTGGRP